MKLTAEAKSILLLKQKQPGLDLDNKTNQFELVVVLMMIQAKNSEKWEIGHSLCQSFIFCSNKRRCGFLSM